METLFCRSPRLGAESPRTSRGLSTSFIGGKPKECGILSGSRSFHPEITIDVDFRPTSSPIGERSVVFLEPNCAAITDSAEHVSAVRKGKLSSRSGSLRGFNPIGSLATRDYRKVSKQSSAALGHNGSGSSVSVDSASEFEACAVREVRENNHGFPGSQISSRTTPWTVVRGAADVVGDCPFLAPSIRRRISLDPGVPVRCPLAVGS